MNKYAQRFAAGVVVGCLLTTGCNAAMTAYHNRPVKDVQHSEYTEYHCWVENGNTIRTPDGNEWEYDTNLNGVVSVVFDDNGTPDFIYDDIIVEAYQQR